MCSLPFFRDLDTSKLIVCTQVPGSAFSTFWKESNAEKDCAREIV